MNKNTTTMNWNEVLKGTLYAGMMMLALTVRGQESLTIQQCMDLVEKQSLAVQASTFDLHRAEINLRESKQALLPDLSADGQFSYSFGRTIDPTTNLFESQNLGFNSFNLRSSVPVFQGGQLRREIIAAQQSLAALDLRSQETRLNTRMDVLLAYITHLFEAERIKNAEGQMAISQHQLDQVDERIKAEVAPAVDRLQWQAQLARNTQDRIQRLNAMENAGHQLRNLLNLDPEAPLNLQEPDVLGAVAEEAYSFSSVMQRLLKSHPGLQADAQNVLLAETNISIAESRYLPTLYAGASVNTNYSTLGSTSYFEQLNQNLGLGVGVALNVPIYDRGSRRAEVHRQENALNLARNTQEQNLNRLQQQVQQLLTDLRSAREEMTAAQSNVEYLKTTLDNMQQRFGLGIVNNYELLDAQNQYEQAVNTLTIAKFDLLYRRLVINLLEDGTIN
ncbi:MAG TPA: TolC family protein [Saprospiraceae bacterium]|nr:TolC family protein [Saprospiraceae bacterium]HRV84252.1 TolC family protein [Saprospiraceae bacterium]